MLFNSFEFVFYFLPLAVIGYAVTRRVASAHAGIAFLSYASIIFYLWWDISNIGILAGAILVNYGFGRFMVRCGERPDLWRLAKHSALVAGIAFNIGLLMYFKYTNFFMAQLDVKIEHILLPLGISFFTFQKITYLVDCYTGLLTEAGLTEFTLFVTFFPHAIAGPIVHHRDMMPQFLHPRPPIRPDSMWEGLFYFTVGLAKKVLIADAFAPFVASFFGAADHDPAGVQMIDGWVGALSYTMQIYFDFSGYSDMAIGASLMFGIILPINFNSPYKSLSVIEFWRRWHMTLSRFLKEYIYFPLGGSRQGNLRHYINLMAVMVIGGFWHGAGWTFIAWGTLHGFYLLINHLWRYLKGGEETSLSRLRAFGSWLSTFACVVIAWVFFRADTMGTAVGIIRGMLGLNGIAFAEKHRAYFGALASAMEHAGIKFVPDLNHSLLSLTAVLGGVFVSVALPNSQTMAGKLHSLPRQWSLRLASALGVLAALTACLLDRPSEFLYFNF